MAMRSFCSSTMLPWMYSTLASRESRSSSTLCASSGSCEQRGREGERGGERGRERERGGEREAEWEAEWETEREAEREAGERKEGGREGRRREE